MKKTLSLMLCLAIVISMLCIPVGAASPAYQNTRDALAALDARGITYTITDSDEDYDRVVVEDTVNGYTYKIRLYFSSDNETLSIRVWNIIDFADSDYLTVLKTVNNMNYQYRWCGFLVDETDNSVTAEWDLIVRPNAKIGEIVIEALTTMSGMIEMARDTLGIYDT